MDGLDFQTAASPVASDPARADVALFVGFTNRRPISPRLPGEEDKAYLSRLPAWLRGWLHEWGWRPGEDGRSAEDLVQLRDIPVPIQTWTAFDALFEWDRRPLDASGRFCDSRLGASVRRFFAQGGRKCYVVRMGDSWPLLTPYTEREDQRQCILPAPGGSGSKYEPPSPVDRSTWRGIAHLLGLPDVSFLCVPDLPELYSIDVGRIPSEFLSDREENFVECSTRTGPEESNSLRSLPAPRCDAAGFTAWAARVRDIAAFLQRFAREVQFVATLPLPADEEAFISKSEVLALERTQRRGAVRTQIFSAQRAQWQEAGGIQSAFVQLAYPWLRTRDSRRLPGDIETPDAFLIGILAQNALTLGTWHSTNRRRVPELAATVPVLARTDLDRELPFGGLDVSRRRTLAVRQRVSVFVPTSLGHQLLSDVTTDDDEAYRPANLNRLVATIIRAARTAGEEAVFDNNGEALWAGLRATLEGLLLNLWSDGALHGTTPEEAFEVRCDRSTMTQNDIDAGRVIARVQFTAAAPIERITVVLAMDDGGAVSVLSTETRDLTMEDAA